MQTAFTYCRLAVGLAAALALAAGCSQVQSTALNSEGVRLYQAGNYQQAADAFQRAVANDPRSATSYYNLAAALHKTGKLTNNPNDLAQAERYYNQCLEYDPNHTECYRGLAVLLVETGRTDASFRLLEGWSTRSPQLAEPKIELARLLEEQNNSQLASARLVEALAIDPNNPRALTALGRLREVQGDRNQAVANYQRSLSVNRNQPEVAARVAVLQATGAGVGITPSPLVNPTPGTRTADQWQANPRY